MKTDAPTPPASRTGTPAPRPTFLATIGDVNRVETWSGIPFHFLGAARRAGLIQVGLPLDVRGRAWRVRRILWNMAQVMRLDRPGGFQYSEGFLERLWRPFVPGLRGGSVINCFQLYPRSIVADEAIEKWFFLDQTLLQLFDHYDVRKEVGSRIASAALAREKQGYARAAGVIVNSRWAADSAIRDYGIDPAKVHVVLPGANLDPVEYARWEAAHHDPSAAARPLRLVFVGKDWQRKGLDRLLRALRRARQGSSQATLRVIGCARESLPPELADVEGVEWYGFIDKRSQPRRFLDAVAECDVGCLLSRAEAGGISLREYHAMGLAVLGTEAGGSPEHALAAASVLVPVQAGDAEIADILSSLERDPARVARMRRTAWNDRRSVLWEATVAQIRALWPRPAGDAVPGSAVATPPRS